MGRLITLTAKQCDGQDYSLPRTVYLQEDGISVDTARGTGTGKLTKVYERVGNRTKIYQVYEKAMQIEAQRNPASTDILVKQQIKLAFAALGGTQGAAAPITAYMTEVTTATASSAEGVLLPAATVGKVFNIINNHATVTIKIYPAVGEFIGTGAVNIPVTLAPGDRASVVCQNTTGKWVVAIDRGK